jgi:carboxyvinyl-carboxyphosphonate phosphorylmutase
VRRTVEESETAGICAMSIEDTVQPRPYGPNGKPSLSSVEEGVGKMRAALPARQDKNLVIAGRTSALAIANLDEAVKRAKAYERPGSTRSSSPAESRSRRSKWCRRRSRSR